MSEQVERCEDCRFWEVVVSGTGECHRYPPRVYWDEDLADYQSPWPDTDADRWCGKFKPKCDQEKQSPTNAVALVQNLDADAIRDRLNELDAESSALRALLRSAVARRKR